MLDQYLDYLDHGYTSDLCPLYLFEDLSRVSKSDLKHSILHDYSPPVYFQSDCDLFELGFLATGDCPGLARPAYRWLLIGPPGSGSFVHIDPQGTSAWNALLRSTKRWV